MTAGPTAVSDRHGMHPNLETQSYMNMGGGIPDGFFSEHGSDIDSTPLFVAGLVLGAAVALVALKAAGFRFNFGVGAKVG